MTSEWSNSRRIYFNFIAHEKEFGSFKLFYKLTWKHKCAGVFVQKRSTCFHMQQSRFI